MLASTSKHLTALLKRNKNAYIITRLNFSRSLRVFFHEDRRKTVRFAKDHNHSRATLRENLFNYVYGQCSLKSTRVFAQSDQRTAGHMKQ